MLHSRSRILGLIFACLFPSLLTWVYFVLLADNSATLQKTVYGIGKIVQFTFPLWFLAWILKSKLRFPFKISKVVLRGIFFGLCVGLLMLGLVDSSLFSGELFSNLQTSVQQKISGLGLDAVWKYALVGLFYALFHSLLEEYYWRGFVYGQLREVMKKGYANLISSLAFAAHHLIILCVFFGCNHPLTYIFALAIGLGGSFWAYEYERTQSLTSSWLSHMLVDGAIFWIGYTLLNF